MSTDATQTGTSTAATSSAYVPRKIDEFLKEVLSRNGSDLHFIAGDPPRVRLYGELHPLRPEPLKPEFVQEVLMEIMPRAAQMRLEEKHGADFAYIIPGVSRFRVNVMRHLYGLGCVCRAIPSKALSLDQLNMPDAVRNLCKVNSGLILVTGKTGSGKSTTLAAMIDDMNARMKGHILTIEDPIEYLHPHKLAVVNQREIGQDTLSFKGALRYVLRQDPDVVLVGEMRDLETIEAALTIAETGHLVFATLHTNTAVSTINRIIDVFPPHQQDQIRNKLSFVLQGVITQQLLPRAGAPGRCLAMEIMVPNVAIRNLIRENKIHQIYGSMQVGQDKYGMMTLNQSLLNLYLRRFITLEQALNQSTEADELKSMIEQANAKAGQMGGRPQQPYR